MAKEARLYWLYNECNWIQSIKISKERMSQFDVTWLVMEALKKNSRRHIWQFPSKHCPGEKDTKPTDFEYIDSFGKLTPFLR